jgi:hypothetical protein
VSRLLDAGAGGLYGLWRQCSLAVLNAGSAEDVMAGHHIANGMGDGAPEPTPPLSLLRKAYGI